MPVRGGLRLWTAVGIPFGATLHPESTAAAAADYCTDLERGLLGRMGLSCCVKVPRRRGW